MENLNRNQGFSFNVLLLSSIDMYIEFQKFSCEFLEKFWDFPTVLYMNEHLLKADEADSSRTDVYKNHKS